MPPRHPDPTPDVAVPIAFPARRPELPLPTHPSQFPVRSGCFHVLARLPDHVKLPSPFAGVVFSGNFRSMSLNRRDFLAGMAAATVTGLATEARAYSTNFSKSAMTYFAGVGEDSGHSFRLTNWKKINKKWRRQL